MTGISDVHYEKFLMIREYYIEHGVLPSYSTIAKIVGYKSKSAVFNLIEELKENGYLALTPENRIKPGERFNK